MASLEEVKAVAEKVGGQVRSIGFATSPCIIPEVGKPNFRLDGETMSVGMGIRSEPGIRDSELLTAEEIAKEAVDAILSDMPFLHGEEAAVLISGLGSTPLDELYILYNETSRLLSENSIIVFHSWVGEYATSMEMAGLSVSILKVDDEIKKLLSKPANTPFYTQMQL